ncbi:MAG: DNA-3-methyladenine glycosylase I [Chitinophagales bacterium]|nr:DNA-3-methyladenine glycosylase I [Chitinophagales bacterium]
MEKERCSWCLSSDLYMAYHDDEWGVPQYDDNILFEFLILESAQAGLSWITILKRREGYRKAFANFDYHKVALFTEEKVEELMTDESIIRNRLKINAAIKNAVKFIEVQEEFGSFSNYLWGFVDGQPIVNHFESLAEVPASTHLSDTISKDLKKRGFTFVGSTIVYAYMQAIGMVNDHVKTCFKSGV